MTVRGLAFAACLTLALTGASARADDAERTKVRAESGPDDARHPTRLPGFFHAFPLGDLARAPGSPTRADARPSVRPRTQVYGLVPPRAPHAPCHGGGRMGDQMALPSLGLGAFGGLPLPTGFFAVRASSGPGASVAPRDENAFFFDALFSQPERVTRAVYFSRALGDFGGASFKEKAPAIGAVLVNDADDAFQRTESRDETRDESFEAFDDLAEAVARADSVMDALVRWRDDSESGDERLSRTPFPFAAWFETSAPLEEEAFYEEEAPRRRQSPKPPRPYAREGFSLDDDDARDASPATRAAVGVAAFLLMVAAAVACARLVLAACDWFCRAVFGEEEEEAFAEKEDAFVDVAEVSLAAPLLVAYETEERATDARDDDDDDDGEQLLVVVPAEAEGRR